MRVPIVLCVVAGCAGVPKETLLTGTVLDGPEGGPLGGAQLTSLDLDGQVYGEAAADRAGRFELPTPAGGVVFVQVDAPEFTTASHTGVTGIDDTQAAEQGTIFGFQDADVDAWRASFHGCPGADDPDQGAVLGEVRVYDLKVPGTDEHPLVSTAVVTVDDGADQTWDACYLDDAGSGWSPEAPWSGATGRFAVFGVPSGVYRVTVSFQIADGIWSSSEYPVEVSASGVAPRFPLWVQFVQ